MAALLARNFRSVLRNLKPQRSQCLFLSTSHILNTKICESSKEAVKVIENGSKILVGGFGLCGIPENLLNGVVETGVHGLTIVSNDAGTDEHGLGMLFKANQIKRIIASYVGENYSVERDYLAGKLELELTPQGTLAERIRAGYAGIPAFYTPTGYETLVHNGGVPIKYTESGTIAIGSKPKEHRVFNGYHYIMEEAIFGDYSLIKGWRADKLGNLQLRKSSRNFNEPMARAAKVVIAEVDEIVEVGEIGPDEIDVPSIFVDRVVKGEDPQKRISNLTTQQVAGGPPRKLSENDLLRERIVRRAALEFKDGMCVNLGIGLPMHASNYIDPSITVHLHSENGIMGMGPFPMPDKVDPEIINAGKETVTVIPGGTFFGSDDSFAIIRGGHLDMTMLGAMQVSQFGDLANWMIPGKKVKGMGGAMDLISCPYTKVVVTMLHTVKGEGHKILEECTLPLTGKQCVDRIITEKCVFDVHPVKGLILKELWPSVSFQELEEFTGAPFLIGKDFQKMQQIC